MESHNDTGPCCRDEFEADPLGSEAFRVQYTEETKPDNREGPSQVVYRPILLRDLDHDAAEHRKRGHHDRDGKRVHA